MRGVLPRKLKPMFSQPSLVNGVGGNSGSRLVMLGAVGGVALITLVIWTILRYGI